MSDLTVNVIEEAPKWASKIMNNYLAERLDGKPKGNRMFFKNLERGDIIEAIGTARSNERVALGLLLRSRENFVDAYVSSGSKPLKWYGVTFYKSAGQTSGTEFQRRMTEQYKSSAYYLWRMMFEN